MKKILVLTLGTGPISEDGSAGYRETQYTIEGKCYEKNGIPTKTNFVAEPIIDAWVPDIIYILGTVKSLWHQFYASVISKDNNDLGYKDDDGYNRLLEIERGNGIDTSSDSVQRLGNEISEIFSRIGSWNKYSSEYGESSQPNVHVLLTKYGINESELIENYDILKNIETMLEEDEQYKVAFDITHSFRSLPIYNLVIFNYIKNITRKNIDISHVYYGNIDASHELNKEAPIVDLKDIVRVLDMTNGVAEFKNTGSTISMREMLPEDDSLKEELFKFDLAIQLNSFDNIKHELEILRDELKDAVGDSRYTGLREMVARVLGEKFFECADGKIPELAHVSDTELKFMLTKWYFNQNRMGLGLATGLEALRDINTPAFMNARGFCDDPRKYRENSESYFIGLADNLSLKSTDEMTDVERVVFPLASKLRHYKDIRNVVAHSLTTPTLANVPDIRADVNRFAEELFDLKRMHDRDVAEYEKLFQKSNNVVSENNGEDYGRIVIAFDNSVDYSRYLTSNAHNYDVYHLPARIHNKIIQGLAKPKGNIVLEKAYFLYKYIKDRIPSGYDKLDIVLANYRSDEICMIFRILLESLPGEIGLCKDDGITINICRQSHLCVSPESYEYIFEEKKAEYEILFCEELEKYNADPKDGD